MNELLWVLAQLRYDGTITAGTIFAFAGTAAALVGAASLMKYQVGQLKDELRSQGERMDRGQAEQNRRLEAVTTELAERRHLLEQVHELSKRVLSLEAKR